MGLVLESDWPRQQFDRVGTIKTIMHTPSKSIGQLELTKRALMALEQEGDESFETIVRRLNKDGFERLLLELPELRKKDSRTFWKLVKCVA